MSSGVDIVPVFDKADVGNKIDSINPSVVGNVSRKSPNIRIINPIDDVEMIEDGVIVKLPLDNEKSNIHRLHNSIVIKVFCKPVPYSIISTKLCRQWSHLGDFHLTNLGM